MAAEEMHAPDPVHTAEHLAEPSPVEKVRGALGDPSGIRRALVLLSWLLTAVAALELLGLGLILYGQGQTHATQQAVTTCTTPGIPRHPHKCYDDANKRTAEAVARIVDGIVAGLRAPPGVIVTPAGPAGPSTSTTTTTTTTRIAPRSSTSRPGTAPTTAPRRPGTAPHSTPPTTTPPSTSPGPGPSPPAQVCIGTTCITVPHP